MNKYLMKRLEQARLNPKIENLVFITAEAMRGDYPSEAFDDFMNEDVEFIRKTLDWKDTNEVKKLIRSEINENSLAWTMAKYGQDGFMAKVNFDEPMNFNFDKTGKVIGWSIGGVYYVHWIYADSIGELVEKIIDKDEEVYENAVKEAKEKTNNEGK